MIVSWEHAPPGADSMGSLLIESDEESRDLLAVSERLSSPFLFPPAAIRALEWKDFFSLAIERCLRALPEARLPRPIFVGPVDALARDVLHPLWLVTLSLF